MIRKLPDNLNVGDFVNIKSTDTSNLIKKITTDIRLKVKYIEYNKHGKVKGLVACDIILDTCKFIDRLDNNLIHEISLSKL